MTNSRRICVAAFAADAALYLVMLSLPFRALALGASAGRLGTIPALYAIPYALTALWIGGRDVRSRRPRVLRAGAGLALVAVILLGVARDLTTLLLWIPLLGVGLGAFWPTLHASLSDAVADRLPGALGGYNMSWSAGKGAGFLVGGVLLQQYGAGGIAAVAAMALIVAGWFSARGPDATANLEPAFEAEPAFDRRFRLAAWIVNGATFALAATLNHHLPRLADSMSIDEREFGLFLGLVFFSQTIMFLVLRRWRSWRHRAAPLVALPASLAIVAELAPRSHLTTLLALAPWLGLAMGLAYQSSLYYSVRAASTRARDSGVHEAVLQTTAVIVPFCGGLLVAPTGLATAPFHVAAAACIVTSVACGAILWRGRHVAR